MTTSALRTIVLKRISLYRAGLCSAALYLLTAIFYRQGFQVPSQIARELFTWLAIVPLLFFFWKGYQAVEQVEAGAGLAGMAWWAAALGIAAFLIFPFHSEDIFAYINTGWQQAHYGQNPYVHLVANIPNWQQDPMFWKTWATWPASYGFLFTLLARFLAAAGSGNWLATVYLFKLANLAAYGVTAWLVWAGATRMGLARRVLLPQHAQRGRMAGGAVAAFYLFAWHPMILMHHVANGHNDILAACFIALGAYCAAMGADFWIIPALALGASIKVVPVVMIPFALLLLLKRKGWASAAMSCLLAVALGVVASWPYLADWRQIPVRAIVTILTGPGGSLHAVFNELFKDAAKLFPGLAPWKVAVNSAVGATLETGFVIFVVVLLVRMSRRMAVLPAEKLAGEFLEESLLAMTVLLCVASGKYQGWFLVMLLPPALFLEDTHWLRRLVIALTIGGFFDLTFLRSAHVINYIAMVIVPAWIVLAQEGKARMGAQSRALPQEG